MTVGERLKNLREKLGFSQVDFADKINVSKQTLYKYENNLITNIPSDKIEAAAKLGNVSPAYLMGWDEQPILTTVSTKKMISNDFSTEYNFYLSEHEMLVIEKYRLSDDISKQLVLRVLGLDSRIEEIEKRA